MERAAVEVLVIGAGMTGIGAACHLKAKGIGFLVLEANADLGGVWNSQRWHGARCDSDFIKYSFSFSPYLSRKCLQGREQIHQYLRKVAREHGVVEQTHLNTRVEKAVFDPDHAIWRVHTNRGTYTARFLLNGNGYFSERPHVPEFKGADRFAGELVHTAHLDGNRTFHDKAVVVVGSGATAVCCAPELAHVSRSLVMLQRSPSWIYETKNNASLLVRLCQAMYARGLRHPVRWLRACLQLRDDLIFVGFRRFPRAARWFFRRHWSGTVTDAARREHLTPHYNPWEQRIPVAIGLKEALRSGRLWLRTGGIERFAAGGIVLETGEFLPCDVCVLATGLELQFFSFDIYVGNARVDVRCINLYKGLLMGGIPNYFHPMGSWHSAWTQRLEPVVRLAIRIIEHMKNNEFGMVGIRRRDVEAAPGITPNYVLRSLSTMPRLHGTTNLPSIDNMLAARFDQQDYQFSAPTARDVDRSLRGDLRPGILEGTATYGGAARGACPDA